MEGPILCYGDLVTLWRVGSFQELSMQSLALVDLVKPAPGESGGGGTRCCFTELSMQSRALLGLVKRAPGECVGGG